MEWTKLLLKWTKRIEARLGWTQLGISMDAPQSDPNTYTIIAILVGDIYIYIILGMYQTKTMAILEDSLGVSMTFFSFKGPSKMDLMEWLCGMPAKGKYDGTKEHSLGDLWIKVCA